MIARQEMMQFLRFGLVGGGVALFYVLCFAGLRALGLGEVGANAFAFSGAICVQYIGQTVFTFRQPLASSAQMLRFGVTVGLGFLVSMCITGALGPQLGWSDWLSAAVVAVFLPVQNFIIFRLWVYAAAAV